MKKEKKIETDVLELSYHSLVFPNHIQSNISRTEYFFSTNFCFRALHEDVELDFFLN